MSGMSITKISVAQLLCPLSESTATGLVTYFSNGVYSVWSPSIGATPAAISASNVAIIVEFESDLPNDTQMEVTAKYTWPFAQGQRTLVSRQTIIWNPDAPHVFALESPKHSNGEEKALPWVFRSNLEWTFKSATHSNSFVTGLELYVLPPDIPKYLLDNGIPLALLRLDSVLPTWMRLTDPPANNWPRFVVESLFNDSRLWYDTFNGSSTYSSFWSKKKATVVYCWMDLWLSDINGLNDGKNHKLSKYPVNCLDTATLVQAIASLGTVGGASRWQFVHQDPYGFINPTHLIGRHAGLTPDLDADQCNNPFYLDPGNDPRMLCDSNAAKRSSFSRHFYLVLKDLSGSGSAVYDSCAGPQVGAKSHKDYIDTAIGKTEAKYKSGGWAPGTIANCEMGEGVITYASASSFVRQYPKQAPPGPTNLFQKMNVALSKHGILKPPFEGAAAGKNDTIVATWTFIPKASPSVQCQISMWRYDYKPQAQDAYEMRRSNLPAGFTEDAFQEDLSYPDPTSLYRMFYIQLPNPVSKHPTILVVVEGNMTNEDVADYVVCPIKTEVLHEALPGKTKIGVVKQDPPGDVPLDSHFKIIIEPDIATNSWWRGFNVDTWASDVLLLKSSIEPQTENVVMNFLARRRGCRLIGIVLYGPNLDSSETSWKVNIL